MGQATAQKFRKSDFPIPKFSGACLCKGLHFGVKISSSITSERSIYHSFGKLENLIIARAHSCRHDDTLGDNRPAPVPNSPDEYNWHS